MTDGTNKLIRNSTVKFLTLTGRAGEQSTEARYEDDTVLYAATRGRLE